MRQLLARIVCSLIVISLSLACAKIAGAATPTRAEFDALESQYKDILKKAKDIQNRYPVAEPNDRPAMAEKFTALMREGDKLRPKLMTLAEKCFRENPDDKEIGEMMISVIATLIHDDNYEEARRIGQLLIDNKYPDIRIYNSMGAACYFTNDYAGAEKYLNMAVANKLLNEEGKKVLESLPDARAKWARELKFREAEAMADDLPRVKLTIGDSKGHAKGDIVVELFENEAPNTVANFISLVEKHFYDGLPFHRVLPQFMAQGGDPKRDGSGGPGYRIACECFAPNHRDHFRGSLSMAHTAQKDTGGSQFFLTFMQKPYLDGVHTVFGRVIEGMDLLAKITRVNPDLAARGVTQSPPDEIVKAVVIRKRQHKYEPQTIR